MDMNDNIPTEKTDEEDQILSLMKNDFLSESADKLDQLNLNLIQLESPLPYESY